MRNENEKDEQERDCQPGFVAAVLVNDPDGYELLTKLALNPAEARMVARQLNQLSRSRSVEFRQAVKSLELAFKQMLLGPVTLGKMALVAEKMTQKRSNRPAVQAGAVLLWAVQKRVTRDLRSGAKNVSKTDQKTVIDVINRIVRRSTRKK